MTVRSKWTYVAAVLLVASISAGAGAESRPGATVHPLIIQADFGGLVMTGVAYSIHPDLPIFNVRPLIPLYDIRSASASLAYNAQTWPPGTVLISVVDPGVGTDRKSVVLKTRNGLYFVSPDNGSLSGAAQAYGIEAVREIDESVNRRPGTEWSHTFHGRDVYAYVGARLAAGIIDFEGVGPLLEPRVVMLETAMGSFEDGVFEGIAAGGEGQLGNIYFNIDRDLFERANPEYGQVYTLEIQRSGEPVWSGAVPYVRTFGDVPVGENLLFINSSGQLSVAVNQDSFAAKYGIGVGADWTIRLQPQ
ncbi:MAG: SAM-dependent chlorinase/fluorinase [Gammaproteobacteria bacterium]|nr:SAM-dependent chlorinase/fluorinase [Gammaproteobacteria bacterium]